MTDKQPEALRLADYMEASFTCGPTERQAAALLRTQHAAIERLNDAATDSNLILERAQATNLEMLAAIERKDALLRQALEAITHGCPPGCNDGMTDSGGTYPWGEAVLMPCPACETAKSITKELSQ